MRKSFIKLLTVRIQMQGTEEWTNRPRGMVRPPEVWTEFSPATPAEKPTAPRVLELVGPSLGLVDHSLVGFGANIHFHVIFGRWREGTSFLNHLEEGLQLLILRCSHREVVVQAGE